MLMLTLALSAWQLLVSGPQQEQTPPVWTATLDLRIGSVDDPQYALTQVLDVAIGPDSGVYALLWNDPKVHVFDKHGQFVATIGRRGNGPGEFMSPVRLGWRADTLWVLDGAQNRLSLFAANGDFARSLASWNLPGADVHGSMEPEGLFRGGLILAKPAVSATRVAAGYLQEVPLLLVDVPAGRVDTLAWVSVRRKVMDVLLAGGRRVYTFQPLDDDPLYAVASDGLSLILVDRQAATGSEAQFQFRVSKIAIGGDTVLSRCYGYEPKPVTDALVDSLVARRVYRRSPSLRAGAREYARAVREAFYRPDNLPPVTQVVTGGDGTIWLRRENLGQRSTRWDVLNEGGRPRALLTLPSQLKLFQAEGLFIWGTEQDSLDVPYIVRYRIRDASAAPPGEPLPPLTPVPCDIQR